MGYTLSRVIEDTELIDLDSRVSALLPCNVILRQVGPDVEASANDPVTSMQAFDNAELKLVAGKVSDMLREVIETQ